MSTFTQGNFGSGYTKVATVPDYGFGSRRGRAKTRLRSKKGLKKLLKSGTLDKALKLEKLKASKCYTL